ncbi:MAG: hypothetical protein AAF358_25315 [Pseudomonadota bacterium]
MKLRIKGNSIRLRLTRSEVDAFAEGGSVSEVLHFANGDRLTYRVLSDPQTDTLTAAFADQVVTVSVPAGEVAAWLAPESVSLQGSQLLANGDHLNLLVEKDFACLVERAGEDDSDAFAHPAASNAHGTD